MENTSNIDDGFLNLCHMVCHVEGARFFEKAANLIADITTTSRSQIFLLDVQGRNLILASDFRRGNSLGVGEPHVIQVSAEQASSCPMSHCAFTSNEMNFDARQYQGDLTQVKHALADQALQYVRVFPILRTDSNLLGVILVADTSEIQGSIHSATLKLAIMAISALAAMRLEKKKISQDRDALAQTLARFDIGQKASRERAEAKLAEHLPGSSATMSVLRRNILNFAIHQEPVLIISEQGSCCETVALALHQHNSKANGKFVYLSAVGTNAERLSMDLFGYKRGAIPSVASAQKGKLREAAFGTLFIDRVDLLDADAQLVLLRLLQTKTFRPIGSERDIALNTRIVVSADPVFLTGKQQSGSVGELKLLLSRRLLTIPSLSKTPEDIDDIIACEIGKAAWQGETISVFPQMYAFLKDAARDHTRAGFAALLQASIGRSMDDEKPLSLEHLQSVVTSAVTEQSDKVDQEDGLNSALASFEQNLIRRALVACEGNRNEAAKQLKLPKRTLADKCRKYGL